MKDPEHYRRKVLDEFVAAGVPDEIRYTSKPHIGSFRLVKMVAHFRVTIENGEKVRADHVILAIGHSARDTFKMLFDRGLCIEATPFSIGFRIEHRQSLIDRARFGVSAGNPLLGAADYKLVRHASNGRAM